MRITTLAATDAFPVVLRGGAVSFGNFDGVHRGHAALVKQLRSSARALGGPAVAVTFDPHPLLLLDPGRFLPQLSTATDRAEALLQVGADRVVILKTTPELLQLGPRTFLDLLVLDKLGARAIVEGFNFGFGKDRAGTIDLLSLWCNEMKLRLTVVPAFAGADGLPISSSRVRVALDMGDIAEANGLLGRPYRLRGTVIRGEGRGAKLGFPTANLAECATVIPGDGVYAARAATANGTWPAAVNVGPNPTFGVTTRKVEAHLIGFRDDLYQQPLAIDFIARLRDTKPFASVEALVTQVTEDVVQARQVAGSPS